MNTEAAEAGGSGEDDAVRMALDCEPGVMERLEAGAESRGVSVEQYVKDAIALGRYRAEQEADGAVFCVWRGDRLFVIDPHTPDV